MTDQSAKQSSVSSADDTPEGQERLIAEMRAYAATPSGFLATRVAEQIEAWADQLQSLSAPSPSTPVDPPQAESAQTWQPIATAPQTPNTPILVAAQRVSSDPLTTMFGYWNPRLSWWYRFAAPEPTRIYPKFWMPLPAPPQTDPAVAMASASATTVAAHNSDLILRSALMLVVEKWRKEADKGDENARRANNEGLKLIAVMSSGMATAIREKADELATLLSAPRVGER